MGLAGAAHHHAYEQGAHGGSEICRWPGARFQETAAQSTSSHEPAP